VGRVDEQPVSRGSEGATGHIVLRNPKQAHNVENPEHVRFVLGDDRFLFVRAIVLVVVKTCRVEAAHFAATSDKPQAVPLDERRGANALHGPIVYAARGEFLAAMLPKELAVFLVEAMQDSQIDVSRVATQIGTA